MAEGRTNACIAKEMVVTLGAVEKHISNIFAKLDLPDTDDDHRRVLAVLTFLRVEIRPVNHATLTTSGKPLPLGLENLCQTEIPD